MRQASIQKPVWSTASTREPRMLDASGPTSSPACPVGCPCHRAPAVPPTALGERSGLDEQPACPDGRGQRSLARPPAWGRRSQRSLTPPAGGARPGAELPAPSLMQRPGGRSGLRVPAAFILAQAAHESSWGHREIRQAGGDASHNLFGIKAGANWKGATAEVDHRVREWRGPEGQGQVPRLWVVRGGVQGLRQADQREPPMPR